MAAVARLWQHTAGVDVLLLPGRTHHLLGRRPLLLLSFLLMQGPGVSVFLAAGGAPGKPPRETVHEPGPAKA